MHTWPAPAPCPDLAAARAGLADLAGLAGLMDHLGDAAFAQAGLAGLNTLLHAASWSVYQVWAEQAPVLHLSASLGVADTTRDCFAAYRAGLYRRDRSFDAVRRAARPGHAAVLKMGADDAPNADHREIIYRRHGVLERLSVAQLQADGSLLAVNLYHHSHQGAFSPLELERFGQLAPLLLASVRRHIALRPTPAELPPDGGGGGAGDGPDAAQRATRGLLRAHCQALTPRELDVCERLLRGWSYDGIAADMGLSVATVKTYRARAFDRLGLHFRNQLFALVRRG